MTQKINRKNKIVTAAITGLLAGSMLFGSNLPVHAAADAQYTKKENVYATLNNEGKVTGTYVVNNFHVTKEGEITDYGEYDTVQNLTDLTEIVSEDDEHTFLPRKASSIIRAIRRTRSFPGPFPSNTYWMAIQ